MPEVNPSRSIALIVSERRGQIKARVIPMCGIRVQNRQSDVSSDQRSSRQ